MKKRSIAIAACLAAAISSLPYSSAAAEARTVRGDCNNDGIINISDLVSMQRYILGRNEFNEEQLANSDMNGDNTVDIFDYILLKQMIETPENKIKMEFSKVDVSIPTAVEYTFPAGSQEAVITSTEELKKYFDPSGIKNPDDMISRKVASDEFIEDHLAEYDEEFFRNNVLLLNYLGGIPGYQFDSITYDEGKINIKYYDATPVGLCWFAPLPPRIAEVAVPRVYLGNDATADDICVSWEEIDTPFTPTVRSDRTKALKNEALLPALKGTPIVMNDAETLNEAVETYLNSAMGRYFKELYDEKFFENNVLILDILPQARGDVMNAVPSVKLDEHENICIRYDREPDPDDTDEEYVITQIAVPKRQFRYNSIVREYGWGTKVKAASYQWDLTNYDEPEFAELQKLFYENGFSAEDKWVGSEDELAQYFKDCLTDEGYELFAKYLPEIDFSKQAAYIYTEGNITGTTFDVKNAIYSEGSLELMISRNTPLGDIADFSVCMVVTDRMCMDSTVWKKYIDTNKGYPNMDGDVISFEFSGFNDNDTFYDSATPIMINQYSSNGHSVADVYAAIYGGGPIRYGGYELIGTIDLDDGYMPFTYYEVMENERLGENSFGAKCEYFTAAVELENERDVKLTLSYALPDTGELKETIFTYQNPNYMFTHK